MIKTAKEGMLSAALKVSKFQKQIFLFSFEKKKLLFLASKNGSNEKNEGTLLIY